MRNIVFGAIGVVWGGLVLVSSFLTGTGGSGAYGAGRTFGTIFGAFMFAAGLFYLIKGLRGPRQQQSKPSKQKRKKRPVVNEEDEE